MTHLISIADFRAIQHEDDLLIFDATFVLPAMKRNAPIDKIADETNPLPHMVPSADDFTDMMRALGVCNHHKIVIYDNSPFLSAARAWWLLRLFGKEDVYVLDGGLPNYVSAGGEIAHGKAKTRPLGDFKASTSSASVILFEALRAHIDAGDDLQIIDARPEGRFHGTVPEPREGLRSGHMPGAMNVPVTDLLDKQTGKMRDKASLRLLFEEAGLDFNKPAITSCGSGVTAAGLTLALAELGKYDVALYDGSWSEWGASDAPFICS